MKKKKFSIKALALAALLCGAAAAQAQITVYDSQAAFLAAVTSAGTDTYNDLLPEATGTPLARMAGVHGYLASSGPTSGFFPAGTDADR